MWLYKVLVFLSSLLYAYCQFGVVGYRLTCYTCMSDNVPQISKDIMRQTINIPDYAESRTCNDPFLSANNIVNTGVRMEPCDTACIKVVSENKYLKVVLRGCLDKLYNPGYLGFPLPDSMGSYRDTCDTQRQTSTGIGDTVTDTCLCVGDNLCNSAQTFAFNKIAALISIFLLLALQIVRF